MSLISKQIDELRAYMKANSELVELINNAANTIDELSAKFHAKSMEQSCLFHQIDKLDYVVDILDQIKESNPNQTIIIETPDNSVSCKLKDALIYISMNNDIVIDVE